MISYFPENSKYYYVNFIILTEQIFHVIYYLFRGWCFVLGVPSTLNYIPLDVSSTQSPKLTPYPNWAYNREGNCDGLTTTYRVKADSCNRLWVLDSGTVGIGKYNFNKFKSIR